MEVQFRADLKEPEVIEHPLLKVYAFIRPMPILRNGLWTPMGALFYVSKLAVAAMAVATSVYPPSVP
ncbi:hypothetical protein ACFX1X_032042 [Malus domestica]